jgi:cyclic di-GMP phosphodiesterase
MTGIPPERRAGGPATVLVVGRGPEAERNRREIEEAGLTALPAPDAATALRLLPAHPVDLILCDASLPDLDGADLCRAIKQAPATGGIPVILVLDQDDSRERERGLKAGADDFALRPLNRGLVSSLVAARIEIRRLERRLTELEGVVVSLSRSLDDRTPVVGGQAERIAHWATQLGSAVGLDEYELTSLYKAALLHDLGMATVPTGILAKPGPLDDGEFHQVMRHAEAGERLLQAIPQAQSVLPAVRHHHERVDGSGYPDGLAGDRIPLLARIVAVADAFVALTSPRPYRQRRSPSGALEVLRQGAGRQWDAALVERFSRVLEEAEPRAFELESAG